MKYLTLYIWIFFLFSCSNSEKRKQVELLTTKVNTTSSDAKKTIDESTVVISNDELCDSLLASYLKNEKFIIVSKTKSESGDCQSLTKELHNSLSLVSITIDKLNCGDYGFERKYYILKNKQLFASKFLKSEWSLNKQGKYKLTEIYCYFGSDSVLIKSRVNEEAEWQDSVIAKEIPFSVVTFLKDSIENEQEKLLKL